MALGRMELQKPQSHYSIGSLQVTNGISKLRTDSDAIDPPTEPPPLHLQIAKSNTLSPQDTTLSRHCLKKNADLIATVESPGRCDLQPFKIITNPDAFPIRAPPCRDQRDQKFLDAFAEEKVKQGLLRSSSFDWCFSLIVVRQSGKKPRVRIDYRKLKNISKTDAHALPRQEDVIDSLQGANIFSTLDLARGFHQQTLHPDSMPKTAFATRRGLWEWTRLPFDLKNGPAAFQRLMQAILQKICWKSCLLHLDDIIAFSANMQ